MRLLHGFIGFLFWLMSLALGAVLVVSLWGLHFPVVHYLINNPIDRFIIGAALIVLVIVYVLSAIPARRHERYISYDTATGKVSVSVKAINDLLARLADEFAGIVSLNANMRPSDKSVRLDMSVKSGTKIQELSEAIQQRVRESIEDSLGISGISSVKVVVQEIVLPNNSAPGAQSNGTEWQSV